MTKKLLTISAITTLSFLVSCNSKKEDSKEIESVGEMTETVKDSIIEPITIDTISKTTTEIKEVSSNSTEVEKISETKPAKKTNGFYGKYQLADMIPITNGKELTANDIKYIDDSKARTIGNTSLTFNEDGTFVRVFPHPSGDGSTSKWTGTYKLDEANGTLKMNVTSNGKNMTIDFKIIEKTTNKLAISTSFGQIDMNYVYKK